MPLNVFGQPIGDPVVGWTPPPRPPRVALVGRYCSVVPLDADAHGRQLWDAVAADADGRNWTYLFHDKPASFERYAEWLAPAAASDDPRFHAIIVSGAAVGVAAYLRIAPDAGSIEVGHINFSPLLQRTPAATEAMYLMMRQAFTLGYRRYEWKCDALNAPSRTAAQRLGLSFEGIFRQALVYKGRNRDTAWYATIDRDWSALAAAFERWLAAENFDRDGRQRERLSDLTGPLLVQRG
jgi:RimJ/RimL family protein N-acetyltransferase